ncbi:MAG: 16S rRNA (uracil(1498)-N(3))-methyltransferase [Clostridiales bacterium]|jgi:16S rRNA (uracil1498-N3)-methyltransferase|nr:16S rRNA (uracil(1498)-N(3))-methyltransferase [Clostridiales bacterium]
MEIRRFFIPQKNIDAKNNEAVVDNGEFYHITKVLRLKKGYKIILCTGDGRDYRAEITDVHEDFLRTRIEGFSDNVADLPFLLTMLQAVPAKDKLDIIVQKAAETGVSRFVPFFCAYTEERDINLPRLEKIAKEAARQCGGGRLMRIERPMSFGEAIDIAGQSALKIMAYENERTTRILSLKDDFKTADFSASFIIGAEGGFCDDEYEYAKKTGITPVTLGKRILRCETAGIAVAAIIREAYNLYRE